MKTMRNLSWDIHFLDGDLNSTWHGRINNTSVPMEMEAHNLPRVFKGSMYSLHISYQKNLWGNVFYCNI
jgi:hypothetical protein